MQYEVEIEGRLRRVVVHRAGGGFAVEVDGRPWRIDVVRIDQHTLSLIAGTVTPIGDSRGATDPRGPAEAPGSGAAKGGGRIHEVTFTAGADGRQVAAVGTASFTVTLNGRRRQRGAPGGQTGEGPQRITAPMPGKIVRVLVADGDIVQPRQPLIVMEAMKMENELRAGGHGTVARIHVKEGVSVEAGAPLIDIQ